MMIFGGGVEVIKCSQITNITCVGSGVVDDENDVFIIKVVVVKCVTNVKMMFCGCWCEWCCKLKLMLVMMFCKLI